MYLGRKLILLFVLILSLRAIIQVSSYSYARVSSPVTIAISSSENSLIAVDDTIKFDLIKEVTTVKTITAQGTKRKTTTGINKDEYSFFITNNLNETIKVRVEVFDKSVDGRADLPIAVTGGAREGMFIAPGEKRRSCLK
ncbi:MAG TPA: hypothetical protein PK830_03455 [Candidatus Atribacteria bacterium]|nr:hypothetical protein [Candidatus Atribacteria bacterium]